MAAWDDFLHDMGRMNDAISHSNDLRRLEARLRAESEAHEDTVLTLARIYAVREAAFAQLRRLDPSNPVLDMDVRERIAVAAERAFVNHPDPDGRRSYERAREVGRSFKIPGRS